MYGFDESSGTTGLFTVTAVLVHTDPVLVHLALDSEAITTMPEHPFFVAGRGWVAAGDLQVGDALRRKDGRSGTFPGSVRRLYLPTMIMLCCNVHPKLTHKEL